MNTLRLEELEQRDLLNAAYHVPPPSPRDSGGDRINWGMERSMLAHLNSGNDFNSRNDVVSENAFSQPGWASPNSGVVSELSFQSFTGESIVIVPASELVVIVISVQNSPLPDQNGSGSPTGGNYDSGSGTTTPTPAPRPVVRVPTPSTPDTPAITPAINTAADASGIRALTAAAASRPSSQTTPFVIVPTANLPTVLTDIHGTLAAAINANASGGNGVLLGAPAAVLPTSPFSGTTVPTTGDETVEPPEAQPAQAALPGVLATLSAGDLTALGRELGQFLSRIEKAGEELVGDGDGLRPWLIAGAAAATACEIARRQMKRAAELADEDVTDVRPDQLFVG